MSVTNFNDANIAIFQLTSNANAYNITLPFVADTIEWWNFTKYGSDTQNLQGIWINGMPAASDLIINRGSTALTSTKGTTNGVTVLPDGSGFAATQKIPTAITADATATVTSNGHGLKAGQFVRATNFRATPVADATGMYALNNHVYQVGNPTTNTFQLFLPFTTTPIDLTGQTAFVSNGVAQFNLTGEDLFTQNPAPIYQYTLGTGVMGNAGDVIYIRAMHANQYTAIGQVP